MNKSTRRTITGVLRIVVVSCAFAGLTASAEQPPSLGDLSARMQEWFRENRPDWSSDDVDSISREVIQAFERAPSPIAARERAKLFDDLEDYMGHALPKSLRVPSAVGVESKELQMVIAAYFEYVHGKDIEGPLARQQIEGLVAVVQQQMQSLLHAAKVKTGSAKSLALTKAFDSWKNDAKTAAANRFVPGFKFPLPEEEFRAYLGQVASNYQSLITSSSVEKIDEVISSRSGLLFSGKFIPKPIYIPQPEELKSLKRVAASERAEDNRRLEREANARLLKESRDEEMRRSEELAALEGAGDASPTARGWAMWFSWSMFSFLLVLVVVRRLRQRMS